MKNEQYGTSGGSGLTALQWLKGLEASHREKLAEHNADPAKVGPPSALLVEHVIGWVERVYEPGEYVSPVNQRSVNSYVVELTGGHTFSFDPEWVAEAAQTKFMPLSPLETKYMLATAGAMDEFTRGAARLAGAMRVDPKTAARITAALLKRALFALQGPPNPQGG